MEGSVNDRATEEWGVNIAIWQVQEINKWAGIESGEFLHNKA